MELLNTFGNYEQNNFKTDFLKTTLSEIQIEKTLIKKSKSHNIELTERDLDILSFVVEMRFSGFQEILERFFKSNGTSVNEFTTWYAIKRLYRLEKAGFLNSTRKFSESHKLYYVSYKGYLHLARLHPTREVLKPAASIDVRTVYHDFVVLKMRGILEKKSGNDFWISDKRLRINPGVYSDFGKAYLPDGIYKDASGNLIAFELEIAKKSNFDYRDKVNRYVNWFRRKNDNPSVFKSVHYVVARELTFEKLKQFTSMNSEYFNIEMLSDYFPNGTGITF